MTGTLQHLDPTTLLIGNNVRDDAALDKPFLASVREHDVLQPITAVPTAAGIEVRDGQRRIFPGKLPCCLGRCWPRAEVGAATTSRVWVSRGAP